MSAKLLKIWTARDGVTGNVDISGSLRASFDVVYNVAFDAVHADPTIVYDADASVLTPPAPAGFDKKMPAFADIIGSYVLLQKSARRLAVDPRAWEVTCTYSILLPGQQPRPADPDTGPSKWGIQVEMTPFPITEEAQRFRDFPTLYRYAADGSEPPTGIATFPSTMIRNSAGDVISGQIIERFIEEWTFTFNTLHPDWDGVDAAYGDDGRGTVNSEDLTININGDPRTFAAGSFRFMGAGMTAQIDATGMYVQMKYKGQWRAEGWHRRIPNKGFNYRDAATGKLFPIRNDQGGAVGSPVYLKTTTINTNVAPAAAGDGVEIVDGPLYGESDLGAILIYDLDT